jgi:hypothetical protein
MACPEQLRLQQLYDASLRRWAQVQRWAELFGQPTYLAEEVKRRVMIERNAAKNRLAMHQQKCKNCRPKLYPRT